MTEQTTAPKEEGLPVPPICPIRFHAYIVARGNVEFEVARCITDKCAWYYICCNLSHLERIIHDEKTKTI